MPTIIACMANLLPNVMKHPFTPVLLGVRRGHPAS